MNGATPLDDRERVEKVGDLVRLLARKPNRFMPFDGSWLVRLAVKDRPTLLVGPDVEADKAHPFILIRQSHGLREIDDTKANLRVLDRRECPNEPEALGSRQEVRHGARLTIDHDWPVRALV
jgi:hypothetical protein